MLEPYVHTFGPFPRLTEYDRGLFLSMADIFVLDHCYAAVAAGTERHLKRKGGHKHTFSLRLHRSHRNSGWSVIRGQSANNPVSRFIEH